MGPSRTRHGCPRRLHDVLDLRSGRLSLFEEGRSEVALAYLLGSVLTGVVAVYAGTRIGRLL